MATMTGSEAPATVAATLDAGLSLDWPMRLDSASVPLSPAVMTPGCPATIPAVFDAGAPLDWPMPLNGPMPLNVADVPLTAATMTGG